MKKRRAIAKSFRAVERILLSLAIILGGLAVLYGIYLLVFMGPIFSVGEIVVEGKLEHISTPAVVELSGVKEGQTLFGIDVEAVHDNLRSNSWVSRAAVRRRLPHTLWMYVEEHQPVAVVEREGKLYFVDREGAAFKEMDPADPKNLPVITGVREDEIGSALSILETYIGSSFGQAWGISELHNDRVRGFSIVTEKGPVEILLGQDAPSARIELLGKWQGVIGRRGGRITYIIANEEKRVVVGYKGTTNINDEGSVTKDQNI